MKHAPALIIAATFVIMPVARATAGEAPKPLGVFKSWTAATYGSGADKVCYAFATSTVPKGSKAAPAMLTVAERAKFRDEVSLNQGVTYDKKAKVDLSVNGNSLKFFTKDNMAYAMKGSDVVQAFLPAASVTATATVPKGKSVTDTFSLDGFGDAFKAIQKACPAGTSAKTATKAKSKH